MFKKRSCDNRITFIYAYRDKWIPHNLQINRRNRVIFALNDPCLIEVITRPRRWPSLKPQGLQLMERLQGLEWWRFQKEERVTNRGADLIARSVTKDMRTRSYVASGSPSWLNHIFNSEIISPSTRLF
ncbi:hypothetical protein Bca4012_083262 [Brassica carinata]